MTTGVLLTYDGSEASRVAFPQAARLAKAMNTDVLLLRVYTVPPQIWVHQDPEYREREIAALTKDWQEDTEAVASELSASTGVKVVAQARPLQDSWNVSDAIILAADEADVALIVMATKGTGALRHFLVGSTAMSVLGRSKRPVALVAEEDT